MSRRLAPLFVALCLSAPVVAVASRAAARPSAPSRSRSPAVTPSVPLRFERAGAGFVARGAGDAVRVAADAAVVARPSGPLSFRLAGASDATSFAPGGRFSGTTSYFVGGDPAKWRTGVETFRDVVRREAYPGVDVAWSGRGGRLSLDVALADGADLDDVRLAVDGATALSVTADGDLAVTADGATVLGRPSVRECGASPAPARFRVRADGLVGVERVSGPLPPSADATKVEAFVYLGGAGGETGQGVGLDAAGNVYVAGSTGSTDLPTTPGAYQPTRRLEDLAALYVAKLDPTGTDVLYATYLGGGNGEGLTGMKVDAGGAAYVIGFTSSRTFPVANGAQSALAGDRDGFLAKLDPSGSRLEYSTYLGGTGEDAAQGVALGGDGRVWVCGYATRGVTTTPDAYLPALGASAEAKLVGFVAEFDTRSAGAGSLPYSTCFYWPTAEYVSADAVAVDGSGRVWFAGRSYVGLPATAGAYVSDVVEPNPGFVCALDPTRSGAAGLVYASYTAPVDNSPTAVAVYDGLVYVAGFTARAAFPTTPDALQPEQPFPGAFEGDCYLEVIDPSVAGAQALRYATFYGGADTDSVLDMAVDPAGDAWLVGVTSSLSLPVTADRVGDAAGMQDCFVACVSPWVAGARGLRFGTYLGGTDGDVGFAVAVDGAGGAVVVGDAGLTPAVLPTTNGGALPGNGDAFVLKLRAPTTDLALSAPEIVPPAPLGGTATLAYGVANAGPATAAGAAVVFDVPEGATLEGAVDGEGNAIPIPRATGRVRLPLGDLRPNASATVTVSLAVSATAPASLTYRARAASALVDPSPSNDERTRTVAAVVYPTIAKVKAATPADVAFTIAVRGADFRAPVSVYLGDDAAPWPNARLKGNGRKIVIAGRDLKSRFPNGVAVRIRVVNADGSFVETLFAR